MEKYIEEVVNEDRLAREKVANAKRQLMEISAQVSSKSQSIYQQYMEDERNQMNLIQKQNEEEMEAVMKQCELDTQEGLRKLSEQFEAHKDEWVRQIVENCLS